MKIVRFELTDQEETMFHNATSMQEFYSVTPKIFFMMCVARALEDEKRRNQLTSRKSNATPMQDDSKKPLESQPILPQPVYKQPVLGVATPESIAAFELEMNALL